MPSPRSPRGAKDDEHMANLHQSDPVHGPQPQGGEGVYVKSPSPKLPKGGKDAAHMAAAQESEPKGMPKSPRGYKDPQHNKAQRESEPRPPAANGAVLSPAQRIRQHQEALQTWGSAPQAGWQPLAKPRVAMKKQMHRGSGAAGPGKQTATVLAARDIAARKEMAKLAASGLDELPQKETTAVKHMQERPIQASRAQDP